MRSSPVDVQKTFCGFICNCLNCNNHCNDQIIIQDLHFRSSHHLQSINIVTWCCCLSFYEVLVWFEQYSIFLSDSIEVESREHIIAQSAFRPSPASKTAPNFLWKVHTLTFNTTCICNSQNDAWRSPFCS